MATSFPSGFFSPLCYNHSLRPIVHFKLKKKTRARVYGFTWSGFVTLLGNIFVLNNMKHFPFKILSRECECNVPRSSVSVTPNT